MGCGKSTHGKKLAKLLGYNFIDLDDFISEKFNKTITELFNSLGENEFRKLETLAFQECINNNKNTVFSTGGGTPCFNDNIKLMKESGIVVYLKLDAKSLFKRLLNSKENRPLLQNKSNEELHSFISKLLLEREHFYNQADLIYNGLSVDVTDLKEKLLIFN